MKGPFKSYIDKRYTYEQLLLLCYLKVNEAKHKFESHMFITNTRAANSSWSGQSTNQLTLNHFHLTPNELEKRLMSTENLSIGYFLSKNNDDGKKNFTFFPMHRVIVRTIFFIIFKIFYSCRVCNFIHSHQIIRQLDAEIKSYQRKKTNFKILYIYQNCY